MAVQFTSSNDDNYKCELKEHISTDNWMSLLPFQLHDVPLSKLAIPGTHDSGTYCFSTTLAPDASQCLTFLTKIPIVGPIVTHIISNWVQCQRLTFTQQLNAGIRYFDLRVAASSNSEDFFLVHTMMGPKVSELVEAVLLFLETHSHEIVLLDFNHFYGMEAKHHQLLIGYLISRIGSKLCHQCGISKLTLNDLWSHGKQVIVFYQNGSAQHIKEVWPANRITSPWPRTDKPENCLNFLDQCFSYPPRTDFVVCQAVLTPCAETVVKGLFCKGNVNSLSKTLLPLLCPWLEESCYCCAYPPTIITADFVDNGDLLQEILGLNYKRLVTVLRSNISDPNHAAHTSQYYM